MQLTPQLLQVPVPQHVIVLLLPSAQAREQQFFPLGSKLATIVLSKDVEPFDLDMFS